MANQAGLAKKRSSEQIFRQYKMLLLCIAIGVGVWFSPHPEGISDSAWKVFAVFLFTLCGIITKPLATGAMTLASLVVLVLTKIVTFKEAFAGFSSEVVWLIAGAFFIARGFIKTNLGLRIAYRLMGALGKNTLGMAYGLVFTDWILGAAIPSVTARAGGVIYPVVTSLSRAFGSHPETSPNRIGAYLVQAVFQCGAVTSAMFLTAMAGNPMVQSLAGNFDVGITWTSWMVAAFVPGLISLLAIPALLYKIFPPEVKKTPEVAQFAKSKQEELGRMSSDEKIMMGTFICMILMWALSPVTQVPATITAIIGLLFLILSNVLSWDDILSEKGAWDTLIWFASLITLAGFLSKFGMMDWFSNSIKGYVTGFNWHIGFVVLSLIYFYTHYFFASNIAHITTMYAPFLLLSILIGTPPVLAALVLGFFSCLFGPLTTYGCGPAPIFYGSGYVSNKDWWRLGFLVSLLNIVIWLGVGSLWWHLLGLF